MSANAAEVLFDGVLLAPRRGTVLMVLIVARISTTHQDPRSLDDQAALCEGYVRARYQSPVRFDRIQGQGSGEFLDRKELADAEAAVEAGTYDLVIVEDLGRVCRRNRALDFCELCEDTGTRLLALNDSIDTARDDWRLNAFFAAFKHESSNKETSKRIRRSLRNRFEQGGVVQTFPYGYLKPPGATTDTEITKDPAAEIVYDEIFSRLESGANYSEVADWLNSQRTPTGQWTRLPAWDGRMVARTVHNPILKGVRRRNDRVSQRVNKTGRRRSVKAPPAERLRRTAPHLAFIETDRYDRLMDDLKRRHDQCARGRKAGKPDGRLGVSRKRTRWPGQHVTCGVCGRLFYWGGHGQTDHLMCSGVRDYRCWNSATFDGILAAGRLTAAFLAEIERVPDFGQDFLDQVTATTAANRSNGRERLSQLDREIEKVTGELTNLADAIGRMGYSETLRTALVEMEARKATLERESRELRQQAPEAFVVPSLDELRTRAYIAITGKAFDDPTFGRLLRQLVPKIEVFPFQTLDQGPVVLRAIMYMNWAELFGSDGESLRSLGARVCSVDLFDPPQPVVFREQVVAMRRAGTTEQTVARQLDLTVTATQRAMALQRKMDAAGLKDPYRLLTTARQRGKSRRQLHPRYEFQPLPGYPAEVTQLSQSPCW